MEMVFVLLLVMVLDPVRAILSGVLVFLFRMFDHAFEMSWTRLIVVVLIVTVISEVFLFKIQETRELKPLVLMVSLAASAFWVGIANGVASYFWNRRQRR